LPTGFRPTLEHENGKPLADLGLLVKPTRLAIASWLLVFFISGASSSRCLAARQHFFRNYYGPRIEQVGARCPVLGEILRCARRQTWDSDHIGLEFKLHRFEFIFAMDLAMALTVLAITTWAAPSNPDNASAAPIPPIYQSDHRNLY
jgi:hypothetical protein